jgi:hypothetical protein
VLDDLGVALAGQVVADLGSDTPDVSGADGQAGQAQGEGSVGEGVQLAAGSGDLQQDGGGVVMAVQAQDGA